MLAVLYFSTFLFFLIADYFGLSYMIKPAFERSIGPLLHESPRLLPAVLFYAFYIGCVVFFVSWPALTEGKPLLTVFALAALLGAFGYGTYEFTNLATLKDWTWGMVAIDLTWGTLLTASAATFGVFVTRLWT